MNGPHYYLQAERYAQLAAEWFGDDDPVLATAAAAVSQAHVQLAIAATNAQHLVELTLLHEDDANAWLDVLGVDRRVGEMRCRVCGCTDDRACPGGCSWAEDAKGPLCTRCMNAEPRVQLQAVKP